MAERLASLPMYEIAETAAATDTWWTGIAGHFVGGTQLTFHEINVLRRRPDRLGKRDQIGILFRGLRGQRHVPREYNEAMFAIGRRAAQGKVLLDNRHSRTVLEIGLVQTVFSVKRVAD